MEKFPRTAFEYKQKDISSSNAAGDIVRPGGIVRKWLSGLNIIT
jgi:hypothetical protein